MSLYKKYKTNPDLEVGGVWIEYDVTDDGKPIRFLVARAGGANLAFQKAMEKASKPYLKQIQSGTLSTELSNQIYLDVFLDTVLLGWENVTDRNDQPLEFSREAAAMLFSDLPEVYNDVRKMASEISIFREDVLEGTLGNSGTSLNTDLSKDQ